MKAVVCSAYGLDNATVADVPSPRLRSNEVRIAVSCAGVSFANLLVIDGKHQNRWEPPFTPGTEVAGLVRECGDAVTRFRPGDRVFAAVKTGGFASEAICPEATTFSLPEDVSFAAATHFPTIYGTAYGALRWRAALQSGEWLLVHGAAGGSGLAAIEIGRKLGARVIATAGSDEKLAVATARGADICINYRNSDFRERVLEATGGRGADVVFDPVGGETFDKSLRCISPDGRIIPVGFASGSIPQVPANVVLVKNVTVIGLYWGYYLGWARQLPKKGMEDQVRQAFETLVEWTREGALRPTTHAIFPLERFKDALHVVSSRQVIGRVVLDTQDGSS